jgi:hypothetical protein
MTKLRIALTALTLAGCFGIDHQSCKARHGA